jgi:hypothetical protein
MAATVVAARPVAWPMGPVGDPRVRRGNELGGSAVVVLGQREPVRDVLALEHVCLAAGHSHGAPVHQDRHGLGLD